MTPLKIQDIDEFLGRWDAKSKKPGAVEHFTGPLKALLQRPVLNEQSDSWPCAAEAARIQSIYTALVVTNQRPRSWELEGLFSDIRKLLPTMPEPEFPTNAEPPTVDLEPYRAATVASFKKNLRELAKCIIRQTPRQLPPVSEPPSQFATDCCELVKQGYKTTHGKTFAAHAARVLLPYLENPRIQQTIRDSVDPVAWVPADDHFAMVDLLLEAHELTLPDNVEIVEPLTEGTTLLELLKRREQYNPITREGSFFPLGRRIDRGPSQQSYREAVGQITQSDVRVKMEMRETLLELTICVIGHLRPQ